MAGRKFKMHWWQDSLYRMLVVLALIILYSLIFNKTPIEYYEELTISNTEESKTVYPRPYSDEHITVNAIIADPRFKQLAVFDRDSLLANSFSSIQKNEASRLNGDPPKRRERGVWLWTPVLDITPRYRNTIISSARKNNMTHIYMSIDTYLDIYVMPDGEEKTKIKKEFDSSVENFIIEANKVGIEVDAEGGWRNWAENGHSYKAFAVLDYAIRFNKTHKNKFRAFQYDVEPYMLEGYKKDKKAVLSNFLDLVNVTVSRLNRSDLEFSVVIPEFYDDSGETPKFTYRGKSGYTVNHLLRVLDRRPMSQIIVMSYRNFSLGKNGSIEISKDEIAEANKHSTKIILAQETGDVEPPYITFHKTSRKHYEKQVALLQNAFSSDKSFGGIAIHYANAFMELK